jgi:hypothetical protein
MATIVIFFLLKPENESTSTETKSDEERPLLINEDKSEPKSRQKTKLWHKLVGMVLSAFSGIASALSNTAIVYVQDNYPESSRNQNDFTFSYNSGILFASTFFFAIYCAYKKNKPVIDQQATIPFFLSGNANTNMP